MWSTTFAKAQILGAREYPVEKFHAFTFIWACSIMYHIQHNVQRLFLNPPYKHEKWDNI